MIKVTKNKQSYLVNPKHISLVSKNDDDRDKQNKSNI